MRKTTPYEMLFGMRPNVSNLRIFGCKAYPFIFNSRQRKLDDKTCEGLFIGYDDDSAAYRVYLKSQRKIIKSIYVIFNEETILESVNPFDVEERDNYFTDYELLQGVGDGAEVASRSTYSSTISVLDPSFDSNTILQNYAEVSSLSQPPFSLSLENSPSSLLPTSVSSSPMSPVNDLSQDGEETVSHPGDAEDGMKLRERKPIDYRSLNNYGSVYSVRNVEELQTPSTYAEAMQGDLCDLWRRAIADEISSINSYETWSINYSNIHPDDILTTKWVFTIKKDSHGKFVKCKARLVARGFQQEQGRDFNEIFSPVVKTESIRILLSFAAVEDYEIHQIDIKSAFLHGKVEEDIYIYAPEGAGFTDGTVLKLNKSLYGIKQAPRVFYEMVKDHLLSNGFNHTSSDHCVFVKVVQLLQRSPCRYDGSISDSVVNGFFICGPPY